MFLPRDVQLYKRMSDPANHSFWDLVTKARRQFELMVQEIEVKCKANANDAFGTRCCKPGPFGGLIQKIRVALFWIEFLERIAECMSYTEAIIEAKRKEVHSLGRTNEQLLANIACYVEKINEAEGRLAGASEEAEFWRLQCDLDHLDYRDNLAGQDEDELWEETARYDSMWSLESALSINLNCRLVLTKLRDLPAPELEAELVHLNTNDSVQSATHATILEHISKELYERGKFTESEMMLGRVMSLRKFAYGPDHPIIAATLICLSLVYGSTNRISKAADTISEAFALFETFFASPSNVMLTVQRIERIGQKLILWERTQDGLRLLERAAKILHSRLPRSETQWCEICARLTRICNDLGYLDETMAIACNVVDYFHEKYLGKQSATIPTIVEFAHTYQLVRRNPLTTDPKVPNLYPLVLHPSITSILQETGIVFARRHEFKAASFMLYYLKLCKPSAPLAHDWLLNVAMNDLSRLEHPGEEFRVKKDEKRKSGLFSKLFKRKK